MDLDSLAHQEQPVDHPTPRILQVVQSLLWDQFLIQTALLALSMRGIRELHRRIILIVRLPYLNMTLRVSSKHRTDP